MSFPRRPFPLLLASAALAAGCATTEELEVQTLPFHVALVPMSAPSVGAASPGELPGEETELRLALTSEEVADAVGAALDTYCFARVTRLGQEEAEAGADAFARERRLLDRAREAGADLLVELDLRYDPEVYRESSSTFWLNFPLFLFAGPSHWFLGDNDYFADVELTLTVYDMNVIEAGAFSLGDPAARVLSASARFTGAGLAFTERADGVGDYALGILVPSGYLARQSASTAAEVHEKVLAELRTQVVQGIQSRRADLVRADWIAPVFVEPSEVELLRDGPDLVVRGRVHLRRDGLVDRVESVTLEAGGERVVVRPTPDAALSTARDVVLPFLARIPGGARANELRLACEAGSRDRFVRSYTFAIPFDVAREPRRGAR